jgi:hypothetical protein
MCGQVRALISGSYMAQSDIILALSFGRFEVAERKSDHLSWDVSYPNVSYTTLPR